MELHSLPSPCNVCGKLYGVKRGLTGATASCHARASLATSATKQVTPLTSLLKVWPNCWWRHGHMMMMTGPVGLRSRDWEKAPRWDTLIDLAWSSQSMRIRQRIERQRRRRRRRRIRWRMATHRTSIRHSVSWMYSARRS